MLKRNNYKVVIRDKFSHAIIESSDIISCYDAWIKANITKDAMWEDYTCDKSDVYIEIAEV